MSGVLFCLQMYNKLWYVATLFVHRRKVVHLSPRKPKDLWTELSKKDKEFELFIPESDIQAAIAKMAVQIKADVEGKISIH